jgi:hypothetical protein
MNMLQPRRILFIDDRYEDFADVLKDLKSMTEVVEIDGAASLEEFLEKEVPFDAAVLDWFLGAPDSADLAMVCLEKIRASRFVPVLVWTDNPEHFAQNPPPNFPPSCITCKGKTEVTRNHVASYLAQWYADSVPARLANPWRQAAGGASEAAMYTLAALDNKDVLRALRLPGSEHRGGQQDLDHAIDVLQRIHSRQIGSHDGLRSVLRLLLEEAPPADKADPATVDPVRNAHMYYTPGDDIVRTGDLIQWTQGARVAMGIVVTPACDLAQPRTECMRVVLLQEAFKRTGSTPADIFVLDSIYQEGKGFFSMECAFHRTLFLIDKAVAGEIQKTTRIKDRTAIMRYSDEFEGPDGRSIRCERICRLDDPYRSDLIHRYVSHAGRIGIPEMG